MTSRARWHAPAWSLFTARDAVETLADDFAVTVDTDHMGPARILHLAIGHGKLSIAVTLGKTAEATLAVPSATDGAACVEALAIWLGVAVPPPHPRAVAPPPPVTIGAIDMGKGKGGRHVWQLVQLVFSYDARLYLIWRVAGNEAY